MSQYYITSLPSQGAWIEMALCGKWLTPIWSLPSQGAWIEIEHDKAVGGNGKSLPSQGAWIEISCPVKITLVPSHVAPFTGSVD